MKKRTKLTKKPVRVAASKVVVISGRSRTRLNLGLSEDAARRIERFESASQRAEQRLGTIRLG